MKSIIKGSLGGASIVGLCYLASVNLGSCTNSGGTGTGSSTGLQPKTGIRCIDKNCTVTRLSDSANVPAGTTKFTVQVKIPNGIPADSTIEIEIYQTPGSTGQLKDSSQK